MFAKAELRPPSMQQWVGQKSRATQFASAKNAPGTDYASKEETVAPLLIEESDNVPCDNVDTYRVCGEEIPPGPDFCSSECEGKYNAATPRT